MDQVSISRIVDNHRGSGVVRWCLVASERYLAVGIAPSSAAAAAAAALSSKNVLYMLVALPIHCVALLPVLKNVKGKKKNGMQSSKRIDKNDDMEKKQCCARVGVQKLRNYLSETQENHKLLRAWWRFPPKET